MKDTEKVFDGIEGEKKRYEDAVLLLSAVRSTLADLLRAAVAGEAANLREIVAKQAELESALRRVFETEERYHGRNGQRGGDAGDIDFDALRAEIGCRLHRLRECCRAD